MGIMDKSFNLDKVGTYTSPNFGVREGGFLTSSPKTIALTLVFYAKKTLYPFSSQEKGKQWYEKSQFFYVFGCRENQSAGTHVKSLVDFVLKNRIKNV